MAGYSFASWVLHMAMLVFFSAFVGLLLHEWCNCRQRMFVTLAASLLTLLGAVLAIAYGSYLDTPAA